MNYQIEREVQEQYHWMNSSERQIFRIEMLAQATGWLDRIRVRGYLSCLENASRQIVKRDQAKRNLRRR